MSERRYRWDCRYRCGSWGYAATRAAARKAEKLHVDVGRLTTPEKHGKK